MRFSEYLITEIAKSTVLSNTDSGRKSRAQKVRFLSMPTIENIGDEVEQLKYNVKMSPPVLSTEKKNHRGFIEYNPKNSDIIGLYCDCADFNFRLWYPYTDKKLSHWNLPDYYDKRLKKGLAWENTKDPAKITNPFNKLYVCKHIAAVLKNYFDTKDEIKDQVKKKEMPVDKGPFNALDFLPPGAALDAIRLVASWTKNQQPRSDLRSGKYLVDKGLAMKTTLGYLPTKELLAKVKYEV